MEIVLTACVVGIFLLLLMYGSFVLGFSCGASHDPKHRRRVVLGDEEFAALVNGKAVDKDGVSFILSDIGFARMLHHISSAGEPAER